MNNSDRSRNKHSAEIELLSSGINAVLFIASGAIMGRTKSYVVSIFSSVAKDVTMAKKCWTVVGDCVQSKQTSRRGCNFTN
mgnify:CR=1 FL=1